MGAQRIAHISKGMIAQNGVIGEWSNGRPGLLQAALRTGNRVALRNRQPAIVGGVDDNVFFAECAVGHARKDARVDLFWFAIASDDCRQCKVVPMIDDLKEFFARPAGCVFRAQIVEDEHIRFTNILKTLIVLDLARWTERRTQVVEQVGHDGKEHTIVVLDQLIGNGSCQVGFAASIVAEENEPAAWLTGIFEGAQIGAAHPRDVRVEGLEGLVEERCQVADFQQARRFALLLLRQFTGAREESGKVGMPKGHCLFVEP